MTFFSDGEEWLAGQLDDGAGETVTYSRAATTVSSVAVVRRGGPSPVDAAGRDVRTGIDECEWIVPRTIGAWTKPAAGDRLTDGDSATWEVMRDAKTKAVEDWGDGNRWLIRTKRVA